MIFAAIANNTKNNNLEIIGMGASRSAASRKANRAVLNPYGDRSTTYGDVNICEFESLTDARDYVAAANRGKNS